MSDDGFLHRWARRKAESRVAEAPAGDFAPVPAPVPEPAPAIPASAAPTLEDVARLTPDADFSAFVARGVDSAVRRGALKKLFADPHFHAMDGLDVYIDDYTKPSPVSDAMLASLAHARRVLRLDEALEDSPPDNNDLNPRHDERQPDAGPASRPEPAPESESDPGRAA